MKRTPLKRYTPLRATKPLPRGSMLRRTRLSPVSFRQRDRLIEYAKAVAEYRLTHPVCEFKDLGGVCPFCENRPLGYLLDNHHRKGRLGKLLCDKRWFMTVCRLGHEMIESERAWARARGYLLDRLATT